MFVHSSYLSIFRKKPNQNETPATKENIDKNARKPLVDHVAEYVKQMCLFLTQKLIFS